MKVLNGVLVDHTKKVFDDAEERFYLTADDSVKKGDIFSVWAHGRLAYFKVMKVMEKYEYLKAENDFVELENIPFALTKVDFEAYNVNKAYVAKRARIVACLKERVAESGLDSDLDAKVKGLKGDAKKDADALVAALKALDADPKTALED